MGTNAEMNYTESTSSDYLHRYGEEKQPQEPNFPLIFFGFMIGILLMIVFSPKKDKEKK